jgi:hypothetical protein
MARVRITERAKGRKMRDLPCRFPVILSPAPDSGRYFFPAPQRLRTWRFRNHGYELPASALAGTFKDIWPPPRGICEGAADSRLGRRRRPPWLVWYPLCLS